MKKILKYLILIITISISFLYYFILDKQDKPLDHGAHTESMKIDIQVNKDYTFTITQKMKVDVGYDSHGIFMTIPYNKDNNLKLISVDGPKDYERDYIKKDNKNFLQIQMGDPDEYLTGTHEWKVKYLVQGYDLKKQNDQQLALSLVPAFWNMPIDQVTTTITMPQKVNWDGLEMYAGKDGSTKKLVDDNHFKVIKQTPKQIVVQGNNLPKNYGASLKANLGNNYFDTSRDFVVFYIAFLLVAFFIICLLAWILFGRDKKVVEVVEFNPPHDLTPLEMGYVIDGVVDEKDLISMFFYFANKGYVTIEQNEQGDYIIQKIKDIDDTDEAQHAKILFHGMFKGTNKIFKTNSSSEAFASACKKAKDSIEWDYYESDKRIKDKKSVIVRGLLIFLGVLLSIIIGTHLIDNYHFSFVKWGMGLIAILVAVEFNCTHKMVNKKHSLTTKKYKLYQKISITSGMIIFGISIYLAYNPYRSIAYGVIVGILINLIIFTIVCIERKNPKMVRLQGEILGFRKFIEIAEIDKLKMLINENPSYFYDILPYAYVFGLIDEWVDKFEAIDLTTPSWCHINDITTINALVNTMDDIIDITQESTSSVMSSMAQSSSSGSSGSNYSSSSGFGGGGGGVW